MAQHSPINDYLCRLKLLLCMRTLYILMFASLIIASKGCCSPEENKLQATVLSSTHLDRLSSASGVVYADSSYYVVGDDSPWLYRVSETLRSKEWIKLSSTDSLVNGRIPKSIKSDFECMEELIIDGHHYLVFLSSGSMLLTRDTAEIVDIEAGEIVTRKNIRPLLDRIKQTARFPEDDEINIEGLAITEQQIYMLHRGNISGNLIISLEVRPFYEYLTGMTEKLPGIEIYPFNLPRLENTSAGFSGACITPDNQFLVFTASVEKTGDVLSDGEIAGSYLGIIPFHRMAEGFYEATLLQRDGGVLPAKLEGVAVHDMEGNVAHLLVVADNDDGTSDLYEVELIFPGKK